MNPITAWKLWNRVTKIEGLLKEAAVSKSLWSSKVFWYNLLTGVAELLQLVSGMQVVPPGTLAIVSAIVNIGLRVVTDQPVHIISPEK